MPDADRLPGPPDDRGGRALYRERRRRRRGAPATSAAEAQRGGIDQASTDLRTYTRSVLLAFSDMGIHLRVRRDLLLARIAGGNVAKRAEAGRLLDACIGATLVRSDEPGLLRLAPAEADRLEASLDGHAPVPERQAREWARHLEDERFVVGPLVVEDQRLRA